MRTSSVKKNYKEYTKGIRMQKYLREKLLLPHSMHCNNFFGRIYVKKTPEQYSLNHYNSQRVKEDTGWDRYSIKGWNG